MVNFEGKLEKEKLHIICPTCCYICSWHCSKILAALSSSKVKLSLYLLVSRFCNIFIKHKFWWWRKKWFRMKLGEKNLAHGRHQLSWPLQMLESILWNPLFLTLLCTFAPVPCITCHVSFSLMITATSTDPTRITPPLSFSRLRYRKVAPKTHNNWKAQKVIVSG